MKKVFCLLLAFLLFLCSGCTAENPDEIKRNSRHYLEWRNYATPEALVDASTHIFEGRVIGISAEVVDRRTGKAQRTPIGDEDPDHYELYTVYKVQVIRPYKGDTKTIEYILFPGGNWDEMILEHKKALERAGMYNPDKGVHDVSPKRDLKHNAVYLFCVWDWQGDYKAPTSYLHFALEKNSEQVKNNPVYNPEEIKKLLPYVPHPMLIFCGTSVVVLAILLIVHNKKKKAEQQIHQA